MQSRYFCVLILTVLVFVFVSTEQSPLTAQITENGFKLGARVTLKEHKILSGCIENFGRGPCKGKMSLIVTGKIGRANRKVLPRGADLKLPNPIMNTIAYGNFHTEPSICDAETRSSLSSWLERSKSEVGEVKISLMPELLALCFNTRKPDEKQFYENFWFFSGDAIIASMRCSLVENVPNPLCTLSAYFSGGEYWAQLGFYPAVNATKIVEQFPNIVGSLVNNLPDEQAKLLRFDLPDDAKLNIGEDAYNKILAIERQLQ